MYIDGSAVQFQLQNTDYLQMTGPASIPIVIKPSPAMNAAHENITKGRTVPNWLCI